MKGRRVYVRFICRINNENKLIKKRAPALNILTASQRGGGGGGQSPCYIVIVIINIIVLLYRIIHITVCNIIINPLGPPEKGLRGFFFF